jgi:hypothetical protein
VNPWEHLDMYREIDASMIENAFIGKRSLTKTQPTPTKRAGNKRNTMHKFIRIERAETGLTLGIRLILHAKKDDKTGQETSIAVVHDMHNTNGKMGAAAQAGLMIGDEITHINHICIEGKEENEINDIIQASPQNFLMYIKRCITRDEKEGKESQQTNKESKTQQGHSQKRGEDPNEREMRAGNKVQRRTEQSHTTQKRHQTQHRGREETSIEETEATIRDIELEIRQLNRHNRMYRDNKRKLEAEIDTLKVTLTSLRLEKGARLLESFKHSERTVTVQQCSDLTDYREELEDVRQQLETCTADTRESIERAYQD